MNDKKISKFLFGCACGAALLILIPIMITAGFLITVVLESFFYNF